MRFAFGKNWQNFLQHLNEERIGVAEDSLKTLLERDSLEGTTFLDVGCGSGLFSLAAHRLGAKVFSFDFDEDSVACCAELKKQFASDAENWSIAQGSILDESFLATLPSADIVYSWGVLHHTGAMWEAFERIIPLVAERGQLAISIYNDQGGKSRRWRLVKKLYNVLPGPLRMIMVVLFGTAMEFKQALVRLVRLQNPLPFQEWRARKQQRGMSYWYDLVDWLGGYPFEVARPDQVFRFFRHRGFELTGMTTQLCGYGCNEFVFHNKT